MRRLLCVVVISVLFTASIVDIVAAVKSGAAKSTFYRATPTAITVAMPASMKSFPIELLPQWSWSTRTHPEQRLSVV